MNGSQQLTVHQQLLMHIEQQIKATSDEAGVIALPKATEELKRELRRVDRVLARLDETTRKKVVLTMTRQMNLLAYAIAVAAADIITEPMREQARHERDERILDSALALFEELVGGKA